jgi:hypothetical protein
MFGVFTKQVNFFALFLICRQYVKECSDEKGPMLDRPLNSF